MLRRGRLVCVLLILVLVAAIALAGCGGGTQEEPEETSTQQPETTTPETEEETEQVLTIRITDEPEYLDPAFTSWIDAYRILNNINDGLMRFKTGTFEVEPDLAESWDISEDGTEWVFHLRKGVQWQKGFGEFTANDVKYSIERVLDPEVASRWATYWEMIDKVEVIDDYTVKITLKEASPVFPIWMAGYRPAGLVSQKAVEQYGDEYFRNPIGTGPFMFESWTPGEEVVIVANPDYIDGPPKLDKAIFKVIPEESVAAMAMEKGELDIMEVSQPAILESFEANDDIVVKKQPATAIRYINMKTVAEPFDDVRVRRAIAYALDKPAIVQAVYGGIRAPVNTPIPEGMFGYTEDVPAYDYSPEKSMELLNEAGYPEGFQTTALTVDTATYRQLWTAVQGYLVEVGIDVEIEMMDSPTWTERTTAGEAPMAALGLGSRPDPDAILSGFFHGSVSSPNGRNFTWWSGADDLIDQGRYEMDTETRRQIYVEIQQLMMDQLPTIPESQGMSILAYQKWVKGHTPGQVGDNYLYNTYIEEH